MDNQNPKSVSSKKKTTPGRVVSVEKNNVRYEAFFQALMRAYGEYSLNGSQIKTHDNIFQALISIAGSLNGLGNFYFVERRLILAEEILHAIIHLNSARRGYVHDNDSTALRGLIHLLAKELNLKIHLEDIGYSGRLLGTTQYTVAIQKLQQRLKELTTAKMPEARTSMLPVQIDFSEVLKALATTPATPVSQQLVTQGMFQALNEAAEQRSKQNALSGSNNCVIC